MNSEESLENRVRLVVQEEVEIVPYDPRWPEMFGEEKKHLFKCLPQGLVKRIEHFGSTAVPGLPAKPIIDILVEVTSLDTAKEVIAPILVSQGYEYFWRPAFGNDGPPFYAWFIKRNSDGHRTHHIHMVERDSELWERLYFRDYLLDHPALLSEYEQIKRTAAKTNPNDRAAYTAAKAEFILKITKEAKEYYTMNNSLVIRKAARSDVDAIREIYNDAILTTTATFDTEPKTPEDRMQWFESHDARHPILIAEIDGKTIGWASLSIWSDRPAYNDTGESSVYVRPEFHGRKIGTALMQTLIDEARRLQYHTIIARIAGESEASLSLHTKLEFARIGTMKEVGRKFGKLLDVHVLQLMLE